MRARPPDVDEGHLGAALADSWRLDAESLSYLAVGGGSYHWVACLPSGDRRFVTVDDLDRKPWLGAQREAVFGGLRSAFETARRLHDDAGLDFVVAPIASVDGEVLRRLDSGYSVAVFPFVEGRSAEFGEEVNDRAATLGMWAGLHLATPALRSMAPRRDLDVPGRPVLELALEEIDRRWMGGVYAEPARQLLSENANRVRQALDAYDQLAREVESSTGELVITHGEPHAGNLIQTPDRLFLVDWDTVALAPRERDLWMLDDGTEDGLARYVEATGCAIDRTALAFYRLSWTVTDIAAFLALLRAPHREDEDSRKAWRALESSIRILWS